jgi:hypothetical protein
MCFAVRVRKPAIYELASSITITNLTSTGVIEKVKMPYDRHEDLRRVRSFTHIGSPPFPPSRSVPSTWAKLPFNALRSSRLR